MCHDRGTIVEILSTSGHTPRLRERRLTRGWSQAELARRAGVSRQLVAAVEAGRNAPAVDAALGLAHALSTTVEELFATRRPEVVSALGNALAPGTLLRVGEVGERLVAVELADHAVAGAGWAMPDGIVEDPGVRLFPGAATAGLVMAGCDPALALAEQALAQAGPGRVLAASASSGEALAALADGWVHAAVVHGPPRALPRPPIDVTRVHLAHWRVGLGLAESVRADSIEALVRHGTTIVQREAGATSQQALVRALAHGGAALAAGPRAAGHIDAARRAVEHGCAAVTIEGAARRFRLRFLPLERHSVEIWIGARFAAHPGVASLRELLASAAFTERLDGFGGYDLSGCGTSVAAA